MPCVSAKFFIVLAEKVTVYTYVFKLCPALFTNGTCIEIVYFGAVHCKDKGAVSGYNKLTAVKTRRILDKPCKLQLISGRKTVFRLVEKIERIFLYLIRKIVKSAFSVGFFGYVLRQTALFLVVFCRRSRFVVATKLIIL